MILVAFDKQGGFAAVDTEDRVAAYAYPTSQHATRAKIVPEAVAKAMLRFERETNGTQDLTGHRRYLIEKHFPQLLE